MTAQPRDEHRRTRSDVTGEYYCIYDGEDWPCRAVTRPTGNVANDDNDSRPIGPESSHGA